MRVAVIPARGGSKRIPRKNMKEFCGKPMMAWSIGATLKSGLFDRVIVSTDDQEIAAIAESLGAEVPFMRPKELSDDHAGTSAVIAHAIDWLRQQGMNPDPVCCIYATAPFISSDDLHRGFKLLQESGADFAFSVTSYAFPIQRAIRLTSGGRMEMFQPEHFTTRSQDLEEAYHDAGQFYWGKADAWCSGKPIFGQNSTPVVIQRSRVQDIDTPEDWQRAELMFRAVKSRETTQ
jgi:N-acylneuraminate cytidylyltransferase